MHKVKRNKDDIYKKANKNLCRGADEKPPKKSCQERLCKDRGEVQEKIQQ